MIRFHSLLHTKGETWGQKNEFFYQENRVEMYYRMEVSIDGAIYKEEIKTTIEIQAVREKPVAWWNLSDS